MFLQAVRALPKVRVMDDSRVMLNSGSFDGFIKGGHPKGPATWPMPWGLTPSVTKNCLPTPLVFNRVAWSIYASTTWLPGQVALHPGADGQYSVSGGPPRPRASMPWPPFSRAWQTKPPSPRMFTSCTKASPSSMVFSICTGKPIKQRSPKP